MTYSNRLNDLEFRADQGRSQKLPSRHASPDFVELFSGQLHRTGEREGICIRGIWGPWRWLTAVYFLNAITVTGADREGSVRSALGKLAN